MSEAPPPETGTDTQPQTEEQTKEGTGSRRGLVRNAVQLFGFGVGVVLLIWCVRKVLSEENRAALEQLREASAWEILLLLAVAASSVILNGTIFWVVIRPLHNIRLTDMIAVNGIGTFLSYLPFKVSVIARWIIHSRRDGVPTLTIGTWFLVVVGLTFVTIAPLGLALVRPDGAGWWWWLVILIAVAAAHAAAWQMARWLQGERGMARLRALRVPERILSHDWFHRLHDGAAMAGDPTCAWVSGLARVLDVAGFTLRIGVAASILGVHLSVEDTALIGLTYFLTGVVSPFGTVGTREAGALAMAMGVGVTAAETQESALITAILLVTVTDALVSLIGAGFGLAWLRADRLLPGRGRPGGLEGAAPEPGSTIAREDRPGADQPDDR